MILQCITLLNSKNTPTAAAGLWPSACRVAEQPGAAWSPARVGLDGRGASRSETHQGRSPQKRWWYCCICISIQVSVLQSSVPLDLPSTFPSERRNPQQPPHGTAVRSGWGNSAVTWRKTCHSGSMIVRIYRCIGSSNGIVRKLKSATTSITKPRNVFHPEWHSCLHHQRIQSTTQLSRQLFSFPSQK